MVFQREAGPWRDSLITERKINVHGNTVTIFLNHHGDTQYKKVSAIFANRSSSPDILRNTGLILEQAIKIKSKKCDHLRQRGPLWLALFNEYWLADAGSYKHALSSMSLSHPFGKILLIGGNRSVEHLFGGP